MKALLETIYLPEFINLKESEILFAKLKTGYFNNSLVIDNMPREIKWFGDLPYAYSNIIHKAEKMPNFLIEIKGKINEKLEELNLNSKMNSVLINHYRDGQDKISWHSDDLSQIGEQPVISSLSLGESRTFKFRNRETKEIIEFNLNSGDLFIMYGDCQKYWQHAIPSEQNKKSRINLTFRNTKK